MIVLISIYRLVIWPNRQLINHFSTLAETESLNDTPPNNERVAYQQLLKTLKQKEVHHIRTHLVVWCDHFIGSRRIANMEDILQAQEAAELHKHVQNLQTDLFRNRIGSDGQSFDPAACIETIVTLRRVKISNQNDRPRKIDTAFHRCTESESAGSYQQTDLNHPNQRFHFR